MKRITALLLSIFVVIALVSCDKKEEPKKQGGTDISYYANLGQIPECKYKIGADAEKITEDFEKALNESENPEENYYEVIEGDEESKIFTTNTHYIYNNSTKKVTQILVFDKAFGFALGTDENTVINSQKEYKSEGEEITLSDEEARIFSGTAECTYLEYEFDKYTVIFAFENNALFGTSIELNVTK